MSNGRSDAESGERTLLDWVLQRYPDTPKARAKQWISTGRVLVAGTVVRRPHERIRDPGKELELLDRRATAIECGAGWKIHPRVSILHLDGSLAVVNKGPGLISVPAGESELSALSILADFLAGKLRVPGRMVPAPFRHLHPLPVHRLDQYTSGAFCLAMNPKARELLIEQLNARLIKREYIGFVEGRVSLASGIWRHWLIYDKGQLHPRVLDRPPVQSGESEAREAVTHWEVVTEYPPAGGRVVVTKLRFRLETGRKHQIRAQAAHVGVPLIGDRTYNPRYREHARATAAIPFDRQALHAAMLSLEHPDRPRTRLTWTAPLPADLQELESLLRGGKSGGVRPSRPQQRS